jgi:hypothetical protein
MPETASSPQIKITWIFWTLLAFAIFAVVAAYSSRMTNDYTDYDQKRAAERYATLAKLREEDHTALTTAAWVDQDKGTVRIPIEEAMTREIADLKARPVALGAPLVAPAAPSATSGTNNAPAAAKAASAGMTNAPPATNATPSTPPPPTKETK